MSEHDFAQFISNRGGVDRVKEMLRSLEREGYKPMIHISLDNEGVRARRSAGGFKPSLSLATAWNLAQDLKFPVTYETGAQTNCFDGSPTTVVIQPHWGLAETIQKLGFNDAF